tara:strand:- start:2742 stop:4010 length:1269 start_codon:yes stop_codon:yes gene_type:complete
MLDQSFTQKNLTDLIKGKYETRFDINLTNNIDILLDEAENNIRIESFDFFNIEKYNVNNKDFFRINSYIETLIARKANDNIRRLYKVTQADRGKIVDQVATLLRDETPKSILRLDIRSFYESIPRDKILKKLNDDPLLSIKTKWVINTLFCNNHFVNNNGLPRGLGISAALSEIFMRDFDKAIRTIPGVYYYARYVDDIIIFTHSNKSIVIKNINDLLRNRFELELNNKKTTIDNDVECKCQQKCLCQRGNCKCNSICSCNKRNAETNNIDYLGYKFVFSKYPGNSNLKILLADKKIKKIKTRIFKSFEQYSYDNNFENLFLRIKFITGNHILNRGKNQNLNSGIYYNYCHINDKKDLINLNAFLHYCIFDRKSYLGRKLNRKLKVKDKNKLKLLSFTFGFESKLTHNFKPETIKIIKECWI